MKRHFLRQNKLLQALILSAVLFFITWPAQADQLGQNEIFFIDQRYDLRGQATISVSLRHVSAYAYAYVGDNYFLNLSTRQQTQLLDQIQEVLAEFDQRIYPTETSFFGPLPNLPIESDPHVTIVFAPLIESAGGYFDTSHLYARGQTNPNSNQRKMFFVNITALNQTDRIYPFLAHELQHLLAFNQKEFTRDVQDDIWLNELRSEYAISLLGYSDNFRGSYLERRWQYFLANPSDSLTEWKNTNPDYAQIALFGQYLIEQWPAQVLQTSLQSEQTGIASLETALRQSGSSDSFIDIFQFWLVANIVNDSKINPRFGYQHPGLQSFHVIPNQTIANLGDDIAVPISAGYKDWQGRWFEVSQFSNGQNGFLRLQFSSASLASFRVPYLLYYADGTVKLQSYNPLPRSDTLVIPDIGGSITKIILMPFKHDKISGFTSDEPALNLTFIVDRLATMPSAVVSSAQTITALVTPEDFNLQEGDFIRAEGDNDVYIINAFGYKRLVLNPQICLQYGHLGARGCFAAVKIVTPAVRDAFITSWYYTNGETNAGVIYYLETIDDDTAMLRQLNLSNSEFILLGGQDQAIFEINNREQNSYLFGLPLSQLTP